jgi:hypothetical protein
MSEKLPSDDVLKHEIEIPLIMERAVQVDNERMVNALQDQLLGNHVVHLLQTNDRRLLQDLHGVVLTRRFMRAEPYAAEATSPERLPEVEVGDGGAVKLFALRLVAHRTCGLA